MKRTEPPNKDKPPCKSTLGKSRPERFRKDQNFPNLFIEYRRIHVKKKSL